MKKIFYTHLYCLLLLLTGFASFTAQAQSDLCSGAPTLVLTNGAACTTYDINGFGLDGAASIGACDFGTRNMDAWSRFTAVGGSTTITFTSSNNRDVAVVVYNNATCTPAVGTQLGCADAVGGGTGNIETVTVATTAGNSYLVRVVRIDGNQRAQGDLCIVANDICSNPIPLTVGAACVSSTSNGATDNASGGGNVCDGSTTNRTVWYRFQATATSHNVNLTGVSGAFDATIDVYAGACGALGAATCIDGAGNGGSETLALTGLTIGNFYLVRVSGDGNGVSGSFCINVTTPIVVTNDICSAAIPLTIDAACVAGTTVGATNNANPTGATNFTCDGTATDRTVWYSFVATAPNHTINLTTLGATYDGVIDTYSGTCAGGLTQVACEDINGDGVDENEVLTGLTVGTTYFIRISGYGAGVAGTFCLQVVTPPPTNDTCAGAVNLTVDAACVNGYTIGATNNTAPTGAACGALVTDRTVWYTFTATAANQTVNLTNLTAAYDAVINVYSGACGSLAAVNCIDGNPAAGNETLALTGLTVGTVYRIRVSGDGNGNAGSFCINVTQPAPTNDICSAATTLTVGAACVNGTTIGATNNATPAGSVNFACDGTTPTNRTVWYSFTASAATSHTITLNNNTALYDAVINVYTGTCAGTLTPVASGCQNAGGNGVGEALTLTGLTNGTLYFVRISGFGNNNAGDFCLQVTTAPNDVCTTATILTSNTSCVTTSGSTIGASAGAAGCAGTADDDVWYSFTARTATHTVTVTPTGGSPMSNAVIELFSGTCAGLTSLACSNTTTGAAAETLTFAGLIIGNNYLIKVHSFANGSGQGNFNICVTHVAPPNDDCANAITLTPTAFCTIGTVIGATNEPTNDLASCLRTEQTVWYRFVATQTTHVVRIQNSTGNFDLSFALYTGTCGSLALVAGSCINGGGVGALESNTFTGLTVGTTYFVRVHNAVTNSQGDFCIQVYNVNPPNDNCETPTPLTMNGLCQNGDNTNATVGINNGTTCGNDATTLWYSFVATQTSHYIELSDANTGSGTIDGAFSVFTGACGTLTTVATCRDAVGSGLTESQTVTGLTVGVTYLVRISSATATRGNLCLKVAAAPPNDNCTGAVSLTVNAPCTTGTNILATASASTISCGDNTKSVWYRFTATATTHTVTVSNVTGFDATFALYNNTCGTPTQLAPAATYCRNTGGIGTTESNTFAGLTIGTTYLVMVSGNDATAEGNFCIQVQGPPTNDLCANATSLTVNGNCIAGTNNLATGAGEPAGVCINTTSTVWYTFTATSTSHTVNLTNLTADLGFALFTGGCGTLVTSGACQDNQTGTTNETGTFTTVINTQYWIRVAGNAATDLGNFCIQVISPPANDFCSAATQLIMNYPCVLGQNTGATNAPAPNPAIACGDNSQTVWYSFIATQTSHRVSAFPRSTGANTDFVMNLYSSSDNTCAGALNSLGCLDGKTDGGGEEGLFTGLTVGNRYYIIIAGDAATDQADFCISVTQDSDLCTNAVPLSVNSECVAGGNTSANVTAGETTSCTGAVNRAMWFSFVPTSSTTTLNAQFNPDVDGRITVFNASGTCTGMTQINCIDGGGNGSTEQVTLNQLSVGRTYYVMVDAVGGTGAFCIRATSNVPCGTNPEPSDECDTAPLISNLNGYCGVTSTAYTANNYNNMITTGSTPFCNSGATIQNNSFLRFTANSTTATFNLNVVSSAPFGGKPCSSGMQMQVLSVSGGNCRTGVWTAMPGSVVGGTSPGGTCITSSGAPGAGSITVNITGLIPGQIYYIMFDGASGQECGYSLSTLEGAGVLLPATMLSFSAKSIGRSNALHWATSSELEVAYFQIDRSYNGMQFESIGKVMATGNSSRTVNYDFVDSSPLAANNFYRLTIFDKDGTRSFSKIIHITQEKTEFSLLNLYPNPANQEITASVFSKTEGKGLVEIITIDGRVLMQTEKELLMNETELVFDIKNLVSGLYMLKITSSVTGTTLYQKFVKF